MRNSVQASTVSHMEIAVPVVRSVMLGFANGSLPAVSGCVHAPSRNALRVKRIKPALAGKAVDLSYKAGKARRDAPPVIDTHLCRFARSAPVMRYN
ncbi:hypothetical protein [Cognatishimia sp. F0-27]|uniref:hypothetical protein n=1 Tax=Cognatishimia sp. F0-27 TaxID=2816855 RepID=UPI001D0C306B|nr:hypothetical protein [Cognatishimia sp. F0-27]MCC1491145.1 hypothetical protein [Cognatishimia sp. F0-27]